MIFIILPVFATSGKLKILVFSKTAEFRHKSIPKGIETFRYLARENNWDIDFSEDASRFDSTLFKYDVLVFLNTTGDILNDSQQEVLKDFVGRGKGFVGVHAASDTEKKWSWYSDMIGAVFSHHPKIQQAALKTANLYKPFFGKDFKERQTQDEWYNFKEAVAPYVNVLTYLDETSYTGGEMKGNHPITWFHHFDGGRVFYTGLGHVDAQYDDANFLNELTIAVKWAGGLINDPMPPKKFTNLLTDNLNDHWSVFIGAPHASVKGLPNVDPNSNGKNADPLGLNSDPKHVFSLEKQGNENVLHISGEIYGALTSKLEYQNYHLKVQFKWGDKIWPPREGDPKDNGILYHCVGAYRSFWNVWMQSQEFQIQRHDFGDYFALAGTKATIALTTAPDGKNLIYQKGAQKTDISGRFKRPFNTAKRGFDNEKPQGEWNTIELYCIADKSVYVVNGKVVMFLEDLQQFNKDGSVIPSQKGLFQIQSEAAEAYYKNVEIESIDKLPKSIKKQL
ncbi:MAG TPA: ThuA domain-containing protein [Pelobium sp.]